MTNKLETFSAEGVDWLIKLGLSWNQILQLMEAGWREPVSKVKSSVELHSDLFNRFERVKNQFYEIIDTERSKQKLFQLNLIKARQGYNTSPEILMEITDIEGLLRKLNSLEIINEVNLCQISLRRAQILVDQAKQYGKSVEPHIINEITDVVTKVEELVYRLSKR